MRHRTPDHSSGAAPSYDLIELQFTVPPGIADTRILQRTSTPSDATPAITRGLAVGADPWPEATTIDTTASVEETQRQVAARVGSRPHTHDGTLLPSRRH